MSFELKMQEHFVGYPEWWDKNKQIADEDEALLVKCSECDGEGLKECDCCGHEDECETCDGTGLTDRHGRNPYVAYCHEIMDTYRHTRFFSEKRIDVLPAGVIRHFGKENIKNYCEQGNWSVPFKMVGRGSDHAL